MIRATVFTTLVLVSLAAPLAAQEARVETGVPAAVGTRSLPEGLIADVRAADANAILQAPRPVVTQRPPLRRRGSMVGYVDDAVIGTKVRLRFENAFENDVPDRAEFFYAKCGCYRDLDPNHVAYDPESPGPRPGAASDIDFQQVFVQGEFATSARVSLFAELPLRWIQPQAFLPDTGGPFPNKGGLGDIRGGIKIGLASGLDQTVTLQVRGFVPTGKAENGLGTDHASIEPALLMYHRASEKASIESQVGIWYPLGGADPVPISDSGTFAGPVFFYGIGPSVEVYSGRHFRFAPVVELVGWRVLDGLQTAAIGGDAKGTNIVNLKIGARVSWDESGSIYGGWGRALTEQQWYRDIIRLEYRRWF
jgi:hypothetical protein